MSQERTERNKTRTSQTRDARIGKIKELHANAKYTEADELEEAYAEIERLNTKCANLEGHNEKLHNLANDLSKEQEYAKHKAIKYNDLSVKQAEEIERLNAVITGQAEAIREQTAKVQERDKYIDSLADRHIALGADVDKRDKEIERQASELADREAEIIRQRERGDRLDSELHKQNCRNQDQAEEIERLRAENERLRESNVDPDGYYNGL